MRLAAHRGGRDYLSCVRNDSAYVHSVSKMAADARWSVPLSDVFIRKITPTSLERSESISV